MEWGEAKATALATSIEPRAGGFPWPCAPAKTGPSWAAMRDHCAAVTLRRLEQFWASPQHFTNRVTSVA